MFSRWPIFDRVLVNLVDGSAINGVLIDRRGPLLVLAHARLLSPAGESAMDGHVFIERAQVLFIQANPSKGG